MPQKKALDFLLLGPVHPFRGGIADTQLAFGEALKKQGFKVQMWSFTQLYPSVLFPGTSQKSTEKKIIASNVSQKIHAFNPLQWKKIANEINALQPKNVVFRYWTPFLAPAWITIGKALDQQIQKIGWVDNWVAHEPKPWDHWLTKRFEQQMHGFATLSTSVGKQIEQASKKRVWKGFHPIDFSLPKKSPLKKARKQLKYKANKALILFFGLIRPYKGLELLLAALETLPSVHLLIVGESYENEKKYRSLIDKKGLNERVVWINRFVNHQEAALYFSACDGVVLPYRRATQSGVVSLAYHFETPLLVTNHPGIATPIDHDQTGVICEPTSNALAKGILHLVETKNNSTFRKNLNQNKKNYSWEKFALEFSNFCLHEIN